MSFLFVDDALTQGGVGIAIFNDENAVMWQGDIDLVALNSFFVNEAAFDCVEAEGALLEVAEVWGDNPIFR